MDDRETPRMHKIWGKKNDSNYDGNCMSRHCLSGTYEISGHLIYVEQSVHHLCTSNQTVYSSYRNQLEQSLMQTSNNQL